MDPWATRQGSIGIRDGTLLSTALLRRKMPRLWP